MTLLTRCLYIALSPRPPSRSHHPPLLPGGCPPHTPLPPLSLVMWRVCGGRAFDSTGLGQAAYHSVFSHVVAAGAGAAVAATVPAWSTPLGGFGAAVKAVLPLPFALGVHGGKPWADGGLFQLTLGAIGFGLVLLPAAGLAAAWRYSVLLRGSIDRAAAVPDFGCVRSYPHHPGSE